MFPLEEGGIPFYVFFTSRHLAQRGHQVAIVERKVSPKDPDEELVEGVKIIRVKARKFAAAPQHEVKKLLGPFRLLLDALIFSAKAYGVIKKVKPDVIHIHYPWAACVLVALSPRLRRKMVYTAHLGEEKLVLRTGITRRRPFWARLFSPHLYLITKVRKAIIPNEHMRSRLVGTGKVASERLVTMEEGTDIIMFSPRSNIDEVKEKYGLRNKVTVLFVGTVIPRKGVGTLVKAIEQVVRVHPNVVLLMAGDLKLNEEYSRQIAAQIQGSGLEENVRLLGYQRLEELRKLYAACDIFVLPSVEEGFAMVLSEAMASGKPLVATRVGGALVQVREGWNGFLVEPGNEGQLAEKIGYLAAHPDLRTELGANSRRLAEEKFDWGKVAQRLESVYQEVCPRETGKMSILHLFDNERGEKVYPPEGAVPFHIFCTTKHLARKGYRVTVVERKPAEDNLVEGYVEGVRFVRIKARKFAGPPQQEARRLLGPLRLIVDAIIFSYKASKIIKAVNPDIVHVHYPWAASILVTVNRALRYKMVYTAHIGEERVTLRLEPVRELSWARLFSPHLYLIRRVRRAILLNEDLRSRLVSFKGFAPEKLVTLYQGADTELFRPDTNTDEVKEKYGLEGKVTVLFAGTIIPRKGVWYLVKAVQEVVRAHPNVLLLLAGDLKLNEGYSAQIAQLIDRSGLKDHARLLGHQGMSELRKLYAVSDIFVLPSLEEGFGLVLSEAMACGKPLIGSNVGGIRAQVRDGWNGFLVEPGNEGQLAEKIGYLLAHPDLRTEMGANSRRLAEEKFDWSHMVEKLVLIYQGMASGRPD